MLQSHHFATAAVLAVAAPPWTSSRVYQPGSCPFLTVVALPRQPPSCRTLQAELVRIDSELMEDGGHALIHVVMGCS